MKQAWALLEKTFDNHLEYQLSVMISSNCWFERDVTAAMLAVKNKSIFLLWELNSIFMLILREKFDCITSNMAALSRGCKPRIISKRVSLVNTLR